MSEEQVRREILSSEDIQNAEVHSIMLRLEMAAVHFGENNPIGLMAEDAANLILDVLNKMEREEIYHRARRKENADLKFRLELLEHDIESLNMALERRGAGRLRNCDRYRDPSFAKRAWRDEMDGVPFEDRIKFADWLLK